VALDELKKARRFVMDGEKCMVTQRELVERLDRQGYDTLSAILFLEYLEEMQDEYVAHLDRLNQQVMGILKQD
jgi:hypothetical protein